ncbi:hypothetical protein HDU81_001746 [Chytriomyces hyalinus]|nr:hypothetical protein HDU81_001746 [Chytriomyces hyalinus]
MLLTIPLLLLVAGGGILHVAAATFTSKIVKVSSGKFCLSVADNLVVPSTACKTTWTYDGTHIKADGAKSCLSVNPGTPVTGRGLQLLDCARAQKWTFTASNKFQATDSSMCLDIASDTKSFRMSVCNAQKTTQVISLQSVSGAVTPTTTVMPTMWAGVNFFFLHSLPTSTQTTVLSELKNAGAKAVRIFITTFYQGGKNTTSLGSEDLEMKAIGVYDDRILQQIDALMVLCVRYNIRLIIAMHDRWTLDGTWTICDAYCQAYKNVTDGNLRDFYSNPVAEAQFDNRLAHISRHQNALMGNREWKDIPEAIYAFEIENEGQGNKQYSNRKWWCDRATALRTAIGSSQVLISTGGAQDIENSVTAENLMCSSLDIIALHSYSSNTTYLKEKLTVAQAEGKKNNKKIIFEEFGSPTIAGKVRIINAMGALCNSLKMPWLPWQVSSVSAQNDFEFWKDQGTVWAALTKNALAAK